MNSNLPQDTLAISSAVSATPTDVDISLSPPCPDINNAADVVSTDISSPLPDQEVEELSRLNYHGAVKYVSLDEETN